MNTVRLLTHCYSRMIALYPRAFRQTFGDEMLGVFTYSLRDAQREGCRAVWACFLRELLDFPLNLFRQYVSGEEMNLMIERILTHRQRSRWQQAGALGFAVGFGVLELLNGLLQILTGSGEYVSWNGLVHVSVLSQPDGSRAATDFHTQMVPLLAIAGLIAGVILSRADPEARKIRFGFAGAVSLPLAFALLYAFSTLLAPLDWIPIFFLAALNLVYLFLFGALSAVIFGVLANGVSQGPRWLLKMAGRGFAGFLGGLLVSVLVTFALAAVFFLGMLLWGLLTGNQTPQATAFQLGGGLLLGIPMSIAHGWIFGGYVGGGLDPNAPRHVDTIASLRPRQALLLTVVILLVALAGAVLAAAVMARQ